MKAFLNIGLAVIFGGISLVSCKDDDDYETIQSVDKVKIDSVAIVNDTMDVYSVQSIRTYSTYTSGCQGFYGYDYIHTGNFERDVTAYQFNTNGVCTQSTHKSANQFNFSPQQAGTYTFRFWKGDNSWITKTIVVE
ncbi:hypothetical protein OMO38_01105 [Chryseobacterium sp. 09-1422]|uniref:GOLD domain-containing protein n=1 Tax=Chryseobacterium kimseyorum TaxID=2984028 RepID=A0ABT3HTI6_9FLAO|nr:hypothetical protein [Chryseobacterium kimseyorum]MCW3167112.1 hypothetical protein [Chryseobacterium kimseyorum]